MTTPDWATSIHESCGMPLERHELGPNGKLHCPNSLPERHLQIDAEVLRLGGAAGGRVAVPEPPIYTVVAFRVQHGGRTYDYAAVRAGDGRWYATGAQTMQGVDWGTLVGAVRPKLVGPLQVMQPVRSLFL